MPELTNDQSRALAQSMRVFTGPRDENVKPIVSGLATLMHGPTSEIETCAWRDSEDVLHTLAIDGDRLIYANAAGGVLGMARAVHRDQVSAVDVIKTTDIEDAFSGVRWRVTEWQIKLADGTIHAPRADGADADRMTEFVAALAPG